MVKNSQPIRYPSYLYIYGLLEKAKTKLEQNFQTALLFIPNNLPGREEIYQTFSKEWGDLNLMQKELHNVVASTYKDHPNPEMRKFWGLK